MTYCSMNLIELMLFLNIGLLASCALAIITVLSSGEKAQLKKMITFFYDVWVWHIVLRVDPNKLKFYRGLLNVAFIIYANIYFASEANLYTFASTAEEGVTSDASQESVAVVVPEATETLTTPVMVTWSPSSDRPFFEKLKGLVSDLSDSRTLVIAPQIDTRWLPLLMWDDFDVAPYSHIIKVPFQPSDAPGGGGFEEGIKDMDQQAPWQYKRKLRVPLTEEVITTEDLEPYAVRDSFFHDPVIRGRDMMVYDSYFVKAVSWDWDYIVFSRKYRPFLYNMYKYQPFETIDFDHTEICENFFDRMELMECYGIADYPARYEFYLSLIERGMDLEHVEMPDKIKGRMLDSFIYSKAFWYTCVCFLFLGGSWYTYDQVYAHDFFWEFKRTTNIYLWWRPLGYGTRYVEARSDQYTALMRGWNRDETVEWQIYYNDQEGAGYTRWAPASARGSRAWRFRNFWRVPTPLCWRWPGICTAVWNYELEEDLFNYTFSQLHRFNLANKGYIDNLDVDLIDKLIGQHRWELHAMEEWMESTLCPEVWLEFRDAYLDRYFLKAPLDEEWDSEIEEYLEAEMEDVWMLRGVGVGMGKYTEYLKDSEYDLSSPFVDAEFLINYNEVHELL